MKNIKKISYIFKYIFGIFLFITFFKTLIEYPGSKLIYSFFSFVSIFHLYFSFRANSYFVDKFVGIFFWLGFWFKFSFEFAYQLWGAVNFREGIGAFDKTPAAYDNVLIISSIGIIAFIFASYLNLSFFRELKVNSNNSKNFFYNKYKSFIVPSFLAIVLLISFSNIYFGIYQKGLIPNENVSIYISYLYRWLLLFGFTSATCIFLYYEINSQVLNYRLIFLLFLESFISNLSLLSRSAIFNFTSLLLGLFSYFKKNLFLMKILKFLMFLSFILFILNIYSVNKIRDIKFYKNSNLTINENFLNFNNSNLLENDYLASNSQEINIFDLLEQKKFKDFSIHIYNVIYLACNRWVGIDAVMAVSQKGNNLGFDYLKKSLNEKFETNEYSFFEKNFLLRSNKKLNDENLNENNSVILPGLIAYLYFSGSFVFLFIAIIFLMLLCYCIEYLYYIFSNKNLILTAFMGYIMASRLAHSGYLVTNNIDYLLAIVINLIAVYLLVTIFEKLNIRINKK